MRTRIQLISLYCGPIGILFWLFGFFLIGGLIPPPEPSSTAEEIAGFYRDETNGIRVGLLLTMIGSALTAPWVAVIAAQMKRIEREYSPLSMTQLGCGMLGILLFIFPVMNMQAAAFRPEREDDLILLINDIAWIPFVGVWVLASIQNLAIAGAIFMDREGAVWPRWVGYFNVWTALLFCPGSLLYFFKDGPFAWDGALSWWFVVVVFVLWFAVMLVTTRQAILNQNLDGEDRDEFSVAAAPQSR
ncbi:hypothetical protein [Sporichthya polymorpha]|uniref:hypothetical protein n=1 Tax=Sporichthya polymorpha TaxID=35751 RepID=UPI000360CCEC|nr:hypothetical protein [Sporichthya polymorpha]